MQYELQEERDAFIRELVASGHISEDKAKWYLIPNLRSSCTSAVFHTHESRLKAIFCTSMILDTPKRKWFTAGTLIGLSVPFEFYFANIVQMTMVSQKSILLTPRQITFAWWESSSYAFSYFPSLYFQFPMCIYFIVCGRHLMMTFQMIGKLPLQR